MTCDGMSKRKKVQSIYTTEMKFIHKEKNVLKLRVALLLVIKDFKCILQQVKMWICRISKYGRTDGSWFYGLLCG